MGKLYAFDRDGVLADNGWRNWMLAASPVDWDAYHAESINDQPIQGIVDLVRVLNIADPAYEDEDRYGNRIEIWTAITDNHRDTVEQWLDRYSISYDAIRMRQHGDWRPAHVIKTEWLTETAAHWGADSIGGIWDDSTKIVKALQATGIGVIHQVNHRDN